MVLPNGRRHRNSVMLPRKLFLTTMHIRPQRLHLLRASLFGLGTCRRAADRLKVETLAVLLYVAAGVVGGSLGGFAGCADKDCEGGA
jgi:hypothetical protein